MSETVMLGGGCFWCTESVFLPLRGVLQVTPGYAGGHVDNRLGAHKSKHPKTMQQAAY